MPASMTNLTQNAGILTVLAKWSKDQLFYEVKVLEHDREQRKCLVKFEDGLSCWMHVKDMHIQLTIPDDGDENIVCCVCEGGLSEAPNEIIMCDLCNQGYHVNCHEPAIDREKAKLDDDQVDWFCGTCRDIRNKDVVSQTPPPTPPKTAEREVEVPSPSKEKKRSAKENAGETLKKKLTVKLKTRAPRKAKSPKRIPDPKIEPDDDDEDTDKANKTTEVSLAQRRESTTNGVKLEQMEKGLINAALKLADTQKNIVGTADFVEVVASMGESGADDKLPEIKSVNKVPKAKRTINKVPSAAA